jgi:hypothetical protein
MTLTELINTLFPPGHPNRRTPEQEAIFRHPQGPAWVLAGPGSGKTEVLTLLVLRLLYVENDPAQSERMQPEAIFVTTFTEKAARNLEDRISHYRPRRSAIDAVKEVHRMLFRGHTDAVDADLSKYLDAVSYGPQVYEIG